MHTYMRGKVLSLFVGMSLYSCIYVCMCYMFKSCIDYHCSQMKIITITLYIGIILEHFITQLNTLKFKEISPKSCSYYFWRDLVRIQAVEKEIVH